LELAYLEIPEVDQTYDHIASSPYWCWGHEIGMNSEGVVIGNEALFTRDLAATAAADRRAVAEGTERPPLGLLGMELLRLGLERGGSAAEAVEVITGLLERYGQWGAGTVGQDRASAAYDNAYAIADPHDAYVLETSGRDWAVRRVESGTAAISNEPTIRTDWTALSPLALRTGRGGTGGWARVHGWMSLRRSPIPARRCSCPISGCNDPGSCSTRQRQPLASTGPPPGRS
jgi:secernin